MPTIFHVLLWLVILVPTLVGWGLILKFVLEEVVVLVKKEIQK